MNEISPAYLFSLLFYTTKILLHRPFSGSRQCRERCREACRTAAEGVERLLLFLDQTHGLSYATYLMAYCTYTAATVAMLDMHRGIAGSRQRVNTYLRALYAVRGSCPSIQRSIDIIVRNLDKRVAPEQPLPPNIATPNSGQYSDIDMLPAFWFDQHEPAAYGLANVDSLPAGDINSFAYGLFDISSNPFEQS